MDHDCEDHEDSENADFLQVVIDLPAPIIVEVGKASRARGCSSETFMASAIIAALIRIGQVTVEPCEDGGGEVKPSRPN